MDLRRPVATWGKVHSPKVILKANALIPFIAGFVRLYCRFCPLQRSEIYASTLRQRCMAGNLLLVSNYVPSLNIALSALSLHGVKIHTQAPEVRSG